MERDPAAFWARFSEKLPVGATEMDRIAGIDDSGATLYATGNGTLYSFSFDHIEQPPKRSFSEKLGAIPSALAAAFLDGFSAPGNALAGMPVTYGDMLNTAGMAVIPTPKNALGGVRLAGENLASKSEKMYDLSTKSEVGNVLGRSNTGGMDLEGRPLVARYVVGRTPDRIVDQSLPAEAINPIAESLSGGPIAPVQKSRLPTGSIGAVSVDRRSGSPYDPRVWNGLSPDNFTRVSKHELGHVIDTLAGNISPDGLVKSELANLYDRGLNPYYREGKPGTSPRLEGYRPEEIPREYVAESLRHYMTSPDEFKRLAPRMAERIRAAINDNPKLRQTIQFNSLAGAGLLGVGTSNEAGIRNYLARVGG